MMKYLILTRNRLTIIILSLVLFSGCKRGPETYSIEGYDLYITVIRVAENQYKLAFQHKPDSVFRDYVVINYKPYDLPPEIHFIYNPSESDKIVLIAKTATEISKIENDLFEIEKYIHRRGDESTTEYPKLENYWEWVRNIEDRHLVGGISIYPAAYLDGFSYYNETDVYLGKAKRIFISK